MRLEIPNAQPMTLLSAETVLFDASVYELSHIDFRIGGVEHSVIFELHLQYTPLSLTILLLRSQTEMARRDYNVQPGSITIAEIRYDRLAMKVEPKSTTK